MAEGAAARARRRARTEPRTSPSGDAPREAIGQEDGGPEEPEQARGALTLEALRECAVEIMRLARAHRALRVRVVGSVARGEAAPGSDVDLLVDFEERASSLDVVGLRLALSDLLGNTVDILSASVLRPETQVLDGDEPARRARLARALEEDARDLVA